MALGHGASIVRDGLVLHLDAANVKSYPGTGTTWSDLSGNGNNGTLVNGVGYASNNKGSLTFDGLNDHITLGDVNDLGFTNGAFAASAWLTIPSTWTSGDQYPNLVSKGARAGWDTNGWSMYVFRNTGSGTGYAIGIGMRNDSTVMTGPRAENLPTNTVMNAVITASGVGGQVAVYINGINRGSASQTIAPASNSIPVYISRDELRYFPGHVYSVQLYNRALTASEIEQNFEALRGRFGI
jgi:hypothetical protein